MPPVDRYRGQCPRLVSKLPREKVTTMQHNAPDPPGRDPSPGLRTYVLVVALTAPSALLVAAMAEALNQDPLRRSDPPIPLFLLWYLGSWIILAGGCAWVNRYWRRFFSLTGYVYAATAFIVLVTVVPHPRSIPGILGEQIGWLMVGFLAGTGIIALIVASIPLLVAKPSAKDDQSPPRSQKTMKDRFRERSERFSRTYRQ